MSSARKGHVLHSQALTIGVERRRWIRIDQMDNTGLRQISSRVLSAPMVP